MVTAEHRAAKRAVQWGRRLAVAATPGGATAVRVASVAGAVVRVGRAASSAAPMAAAAQAVVVGEAEASGAAQAEDAAGR